MDQSQMNRSTSTNWNQQPQDREFTDQIQSDLVEFSRAFTNVDVQIAASFFAPDATLINPAGVRVTGRDKIAQVMRDDLSSFLKGSRSEFKIENYRLLSNDLAVVDLHQELQGIQAPVGTTTPTSFHVVCVMKKTGNRWLWQDVRPYAFLQAPQASVH